MHFIRSIYHTVTFVTQCTHKYVLFCRIMLGALKGWYLSFIYIPSQVSACVGDVRLWMRLNRLQINMTNTKVVWCASARRRQHIPDDSMDIVQPVRYVTLIQIRPCRRMSSELYIKLLRSSTSNSQHQSFGRRVAHRVTDAVTAVSLDHGDAALACLPTHLLERLQTVLNDTERVLGSRK